MFGTHFYHQRIRKAVAVFGSLFNDIYVVRTNAAGASLSQVKVPLSYSPKRDFVARIDAMNVGEDAERQIALKLPRMSFEILAMQYDAGRQMPRTNACPVYPDNYESGASKLYTPVPYIISFQLNAYAKTQDDALQIVEQILPYFTPNYTVTVKPLNDYDVIEDSPITLTGITFSDDYEAPLENRRSIIYTMDFDMKIYLYKSIADGSNIIEEACVNFLNLDADPEQELFVKTCTDSAWIASPLSASILEDNNYSATFTVTNIPVSGTPVSFATTAAPNGTATATYSTLTTNDEGIITATGTWDYQPNPDWNGVDSFNINVLGDWGTRSFPVTVTVDPIQDAYAVSASTTVDTPVVITVSGNDLWTTVNTVYSVAVGGQPSNGSVVVLDAAAGTYEYTPNPGYTGQDTFVYRASPEFGTSETAIVTVTIT